MSQRNLAARDHKLMYWLAGLVASGAILIERKPRRAELALYVLPRAADSLYQIMVHHRLLARLPQGEAVLFAAGMGVLMYFYERKAVAGPGARPAGKSGSRRGGHGAAPTEGADADTAATAAHGGGAGALPADRRLAAGASEYVTDVAAEAPPAVATEDAMPALLRTILRTFIPSEGHA
jgi:hypothetical protein